MIIDPESGMALDPLEESTPPMDRRSLSAFKPIPDLIKKALTGQIHTSRPLKDNDVATFQAHHVQIVLDRALGYDMQEIAERTGWGYGTVVKTLDHPFAEEILGTLLSQLAEGIADPLERIRAHAHEAISMKVEILRDPKAPKTLKNTIASDLLDRAGFGARQRVEVSQAPQQPVIPLSASNRLADALLESKQVPAVDYTRFLQKGEPPSQDLSLELPEIASGDPEASLGDPRAEAAA